MTIKAAVIGHPVSHSKSPLIHNYWIEKYGLSGTYGVRDITPEKLEKGVKALMEEGYNGFNVTVPHKESIFALCDDISESAQKIGAVNTVSIQDGKLYGTNTDAFGFIQNIEAQAGEKPFQATAGIIGAGGAARAAIIGLLEKGVEEIRITNRTKSRAENLQQLSPQKITVIDWDERTKMLDGLSLLANTTSLGMKGQPALEIELSSLPQDACVCDIVYTPLMTPLLEATKKQGNIAITGIGMLLQQARPAFELWFGVMPDIDETLQNLVLS